MSNFKIIMIPAYYVVDVNLFFFLVVVVVVVDIWGRANPTSMVHPKLNRYG